MVHCSRSSSGIAGVAPQDAGAASGLVNVAHQLGGSLGLGVLVVIFTAAPADSSDVRTELAQRISTALTAGSGLLVLALTVFILFIVRRPASQVAAVSASPR